MNKKIKAKWLRALRSGKFKQGKGTLCQKTDAGYEFCCLGVLAHIAIDEPWRRIGGRFTFKGNEGYTTIFGDEVAQKFGLSVMAHNSLTRMNDDGQSFSEIANWIEKHL